MRIVAGQARGRRLKGPAEHVRPTSGRVKTSLFDTIGEWIIGRTVVDLCAGAGGLGIEALSRGAAYAVFVDNDHRALRTIRQNLDVCGLLDRSAVWRADAQAALDHLAHIGCAVDLILADPPYGDPVVDEVVRVAGTLPVLNQGGLLVIEHHRLSVPALSEGRLPLIRRRSTGDTALSFYRFDTTGHPASLPSAGPSIHQIKPPPHAPRKRR